MVLNVTVRTNLPKFRARMLKKINNLEKANIRTLNQLAKLGVFTAKRLAPRAAYDSPNTVPGELINGIRSQKISSKHYRVISSVAPRGGGFLHNFWVNMTAPYDKPKMRWNRYSPTRYGTGPANYTGTPGYFDKAFKVVRDRAARTAIKNIRVVLNK